VVREIDCPISVGMMPLANLLEVMLIEASLVIENSDEGNDPVNKLEAMVTEISAVKLEIDDGIVPLIDLEGKLIVLISGAVQVIPVHVQTSEEGTPLLLHCHPDIPLNVVPRLVADTKSHITVSCSVGALVGARVGSDEGTYVGLLDGMEVGSRDGNEEGIDVGLLDGIDVRVPITSLDLSTIT
jgi:hypothetical protein